MLRSLEAGPVQRPERRPLRAGGHKLHAFHFAHPALSGFDRASDSERASGRASSIEARSACDRRSSSDDGAPRGGGRARTGGVEKGEVHDRPRGRGVRRADHFHHSASGFSSSWRRCSSKGWCRWIRCRATAYEYHENVRKIMGVRHRRQFSIGDQVRVRLDRVDGVEKKLTFGFVSYKK